MGWLILPVLLVVTSLWKMRLGTVGDGWLVGVLCSIAAIGWLASRALAVRRLPLLPDEATLRAVGLDAYFDLHVLRARNVVAHYFSIPGERLNPAATLGVVANSIRWFGTQSVGLNDLLADLRESYGCAGVPDDTPVAEVVRVMAQAFGSGHGAPP